MASGPSKSKSKSRSPRQEEKPQGFASYFQGNWWWLWGGLALGAVVIWQGKSKPLDASKTISGVATEAGLPTYHSASSPQFTMERLRQPDEAVFAEYAGSSSCVPCHREVFDKWQPSNHALAERSLDASVDRSAFDPMKTFHVGSVKTQVSSDGETFQVDTLGLGGTNKIHSIERVIGHEPLRQFLVDQGRGKLQAMDVSWDPHRMDWFNVYGDEDRTSGEWGHWTGRGMNWNSMCAGCHNTRLRKNYDAEQDAYHTAMAEMSVGCESCHGPLKNHVQYYQHPPEGEEPPPVHLGKRDPQQVLNTCGSCHSRRTELTGDFLPGEPFLDHYSLVVPDASEIYYPDGQVREENYVYTSFLSSRMHHAGVHCLDCHDPHSNKTILPGNALCMRCHSGGYPGSPVIEPGAHMFHAAETPGGRCVDCHMPQTTYMQRHPRRDHGFTIPDPLLTRELGIPNACNRCHEDQTTDWAVEFTQAWYGDRLDRPTRERARWVAAARSAREGTHRPMLAMLRDDLTQPFWKAVAARMLDIWWFEDGVSQALVEASLAEDALIRSQVAIAMGPAAQAKHPAISKALNDLLEDPVRSVRVNAAWALRGELKPTSLAGQELEHFLNLHLDQPSGQMQKGAWYLAKGDVGSALKRYEQAVRWDPNSAPLRHELGVIASMSGDPQRALKEMQEACRLDPTEGEYFYKLALAWNELGRNDQVMQSLLKAVEVNPDHSRAWYNLGLAYHGKGQQEDALRSLIRGESANPFDPEIPYARATILLEMGRLEEAQRAARRCLEITPNFEAARTLLNRTGGF
jgi:tetratricopeptide (TPR) repeat protein